MERDEFERLFNTPIDMFAFEQNRMNILVRMFDNKIKIEKLTKENVSPFRITCIVKEGEFTFADNVDLLNGVSHCSYIVHRDLIDLGMKGDADYIIRQINLQNGIKTF